MIKNIVFDIGNVLVRFQPDEAMREIGIEENKIAALAHATYENPVWVELDRGVIPENEIIDEMRYNIIDDYTVLASNTDWKYTGDIVVPQKVTASDGKKYPVTALEEGCYRDCKTVTSVLLP